MRRLLQSKRRAPKGQDLQHHLQVLEFLRFQRHGLQKPFWKRTRKAAVSLIAAANGHGNRVRKRIINNEKSWIKGRHISSTHQGKSPMLHRLIDDEGTKLALREYLAGAGEAITGQSVAYAISQYWQTGILPFEEKPELKNPSQSYSSETNTQLAALAESRREVQNTLSSQTAVKWLQEMGYKFRDVRKGVYKDGHERADVVAYRQAEFLPALQALENRMVHWELINANGEEELRMVYPSDLPPGVRPVVLIVHDESTFNANDGRLKIWVKEDNLSLKKKTRGKGIIVSDFLTPGGRLRVPDNINNPPVTDYGMLDEGPKCLDSQLAACSIKYGVDNW